MAAMRCDAELAHAFSESARKSAAASPPPPTCPPRAVPNAKHTCTKHKQQPPKHHLRNVA
eukprot:3198008-Prymnesium_polylepis.1